MEFSLKGIIAIAGKPGLYKVIAQGHNNNVIVESLIDKKRMPAYATSKISSLEDITMYSTGEEDKPLHQIIKAIYDKENGGTCIDAKDEAKHAEYLASVFPDYDKEKIYSSDIKKLFSWYNLMHSSGELKRIAEEASKPKEEKPVEEKKKEVKTIEKKAEKEKPASKEKAPAKKEEKKEEKKKTEKSPAKKDAKTTVKKSAAKSKSGGTSKAKSAVNKKATGSKRGG
jgi:type IV secretory pathway VirB10-like protein